MLTKNIVKTLSALTVFGAIILLGSLSSAEPERIKQQDIDLLLKKLHPSPPDSAGEDTTKNKKPLWKPFTQGDRQGDPYGKYGTSQGSSPLKLGYPSNYQYDITPNMGGKLILSERIGNFDFRPSSQISLVDYNQILLEKQQKDYWNMLSGGGKDGAVSSGGILPPIKVPKFLEGFLGSDEINIQPQGNITLDFGGKWQRNWNPSIPIAQQRIGGLHFDQQISLNLVGNIGEFIPVNINWDTKNTFQFENLFKIGYEANEEDILQELKFGNVSLTTSNSLISGSQNLMGIQSRLRFGKLWINTVVSSQRGTTETMVVRGGAKGREFELRADQYEYNQHFFLADFFRNLYENALRTSPVITSGVVINRVEVYVTNRNNNTQTLRNVLAMMDLGEGNPYRTNNTFIGQGNAGVASNDANDLFTNMRSDSTLRDVNEVGKILENTSYGLEKGTDYEVLRSARKLSEQEYTFHRNLGYISLKTPIRNDEIVAVSFEFTYNGKVYKVGEMTENYQGYRDSDAILLKMLKPSTIRTDLPTWDLMMKNIYSLNTNQLARNNFQLRVIYRDDATGIDNPNLQEGIKTANVPLVQIFGFDLLNPNNDPQPDGNFDFVDGLTIDAQNGRIIFPRLEPFGTFMQSQFDPQTELQLINKYVFDELYRRTQADAQLLTSKSKYFLKGSYQATTSNQIQLPGINISPSSVSVRAGSTVLSEGSDYTVDYSFGRVTILNQGVLSSGKDIIIQYERADLFNFQTRNLYGFDAEYRLNKNMRFTSTLLHLNERPNITRLSIGNEPTRNTMWGFGMDYQSESGFITRLIDKIPGVNTKSPSNITFKGEFAQIIPGTNRMIKKDDGTSYIDDFEGAEIPYDLTRQPLNWSLGSTPMQFRSNTLENDLAFNYKRAKMAWYTIDNTVFNPGQTAGLGSRTPANITPTTQSNHYVRAIGFDEIFRGRDPGLINQPEQAFNLAYFPEERGMYNYNLNLTNEGLLQNPRENFGAVTRAITYDTDFDNINVQYIEFWLLDPFIEGSNGEIITKVNGRESRQNNTTGGELYFNLGNISEDIIPDGRHGFENGLPPDENVTDTTRTPYGIVTTRQFLTNAFDANEGGQVRQDVGYDGLSDEQEKEFFADYLSQIRGKVSGEVLSAIENDPSNDNFQFYLGDKQDQEDLLVIDRYKAFNGSEKNSPLNSVESSTNQPNNEDLNQDNTLNDLDGYYEYKVDLNPDLDLDHKYIVNKVTLNKNGDDVNWYQFRIPIREFDRKIGAIEDFKTIRFIRMYMTNWQQPVVLRMVGFQFVGTQWRPFIGDLREPGLNMPTEPYDPQFNVSSIDIESNGVDAGGPYDLPCGFVRDIDVASGTNARRNEQSIQLCVNRLKDRDTRAIFKNVTLDLINYERLRLFLHASSDDALDGEMTAFLRMGTDFKENYYEIEVPLVMSPDGAIACEEIWPTENEINIPLAELVQIKKERNQENLSLKVPYISSIDQFKITIVGNPDLSNIQTMMIGVRNPESNDRLAKSVCVWANELRVTGFNKQSGWAANAQLNMQLADLASLSAAVRYSTPFFGGIQDKISQRTRAHDLSYDISSNIQLDKIFLHKLGFSLPMYVSYERNTSTPYFNPLDPDMPLSEADGTFPATKEVENFTTLVQDDMIRRSINFTNVKKMRVRKGGKTMPWSIENFTLNYSFTDTRAQDIRTHEYYLRHIRYGLAYSFTNPLKPIEPFKNSIALDAPYLKFLKQFNFNPLPSNLTIRGDIDRRYVKTQLRNATLETFGILPMFEKSYTFDRNYNVRWALTKNLGIDYNAKAFAIIDEPAGAIDTQEKRDSVRTNLQNLGRIKNFDHTIAVNYKLPFEFIPLTDWIRGDIKYSAGYIWTAGALGVADSLGNTAQNNNNLTVTGQLDFQRLYNKSAFLKSINNPQKGKNPPVAGEARKRRIEARINLKNNKLASQKQRFEQQTQAAKKDTLYASKRAYKRHGEKLDKIDEKIAKLDDKLTIMISERKLRNIDSAKVKLERKKLRRIEKFEAKRQKRKRADSLRFIQSETDSLVNKEALKFNRKAEKTQQKIEQLQETLQEVARNVKERQLAQKSAEKQGNDMTRNLVGVLMMVKKINFNYTAQNGTILPGLLTSPRYLGMDENFESPGWGFVFGSQDPVVKERAALNGWLGRSSVLNNPFLQNRTQTVSMRATVEPLKDFKLQIEAKKSVSGNYSEIFRYNADENTFVSESPIRNGAYKISFIGISTLFKRDNASNNSPIFDDFIAHRNIIKRRLDANSTVGEFDQNAQDVLIPAFLAAYSGREPESQNLNAFPNLPLPNWQLTYNGLSKIKALKEIFRTIQIQHGYASEYNVGNYASSMLYGYDYLSFNLSEQNIPQANAIDPTTQALAPVFIMSQITMSERFSPLVGVRVRTANNLDITTKVNMQRDVALNLSNAQVTELKNTDFTLDFGWTKAGFKVPFRIGGKQHVLKNDLTARIAMTFRDTKTAQRKITETDQQSTTVTAGNQNLQIKPTVSYVVNEKLNIQFYFDRSVNTPRVQNTFNRANTAFGMQLRWSL